MDAVDRPPVQVRMATRVPFSNPSPSSDGMTDAMLCYVKINSRGSTADQLRRVVPGHVGDSVLIDIPPVPIECPRANEQKRGTREEC